MAAAKRDDAAKLKALADSHGMGSACDDMLDVAAEMEAEADELAAEAADLKDTLQKIEATQKATALMKAEAAKLNAQAAKLEAATDCDAYSLGLAKAVTTVKAKLNPTQQKILEEMMYDILAGAAKGAGQAPVRRPEQTLHA
jgi:ABC-type transporter Mla subunit MlaD